ncbi:MULTISPECIES: DUF4411 family protein [Rhodopirellula]|uniref:DUF4411 family protein n=1 Tax=Rhodopirellula TaxID=265488 RepID=UPI00257AC50C|nr:DUF4411 family protein [Rhodopirellula sp. UBA1907]
MTDESFVMDADSFISSHRMHYGFDFCPGFWSAILMAHRQRRLVSIARVKDELAGSEDELSDWVKQIAPESFFAKLDNQGVLVSYTEISEFVQNSTQYKASAKAKFLDGADPWLIAYAKVNRCTIVTHEVPAPLSTTKVKIPDAAKHFNVDCIAPYEMLRRLPGCLTYQEESGDRDLF